MVQTNHFKTELAAMMPWNEGAPKINGPRVFGAGIDSPFFFPVPVTGERPLAFSTEDLPKGLTMDAASGIISGVVAKEIDATVNINVSNSVGRDEQTLKIIAGSRLALTPPLGWSSWNAWGSAIDEQKIRDCADTMVSSGLAAHGFSYVNIDDGWQGERGSALNAIQPNEKFKDMKALCDYVHALGLRIGIYSTPWVKSFLRLTGGSSGKCIHCDPSRMPEKDHGHYFGEHSHHREDATQWAEWGIDYLKYDWSPWQLPVIEAMHDALRDSGRDMIYSLSNGGPFEDAADWARLANCWRTTGDITDTWDSISRIGFSQDRWTPYAGPGHWTDPDMLVVDKVLGWREGYGSGLTENEQITHITLWAILAAPLLLGCDLSQMEQFTLNLMCNDEMLAVNQDIMGKQGHCVRETRRTDQNGQTTVHENVYVRPLHDGRFAVGLFNRTERPATVRVDWEELGIHGSQQVRDIWANRDIGVFDSEFSMGVPSHGAQFILLK